MPKTRARPDVSNQVRALYANRDRLHVIERDLEIVEKRIQTEVGELRQITRQGLAIVDLLLKAVKES